MKAATGVSRDVYGIAHVKAGNDHDLYFLQGFVHAQGVGMGLASEPAGTPALLVDRLTARSEKEDRRRVIG